VLPVVEEIALDAPGLVVDLTPLGAGIDDGFKAAQVKRLAGRVVFGFQAVGRGNGPGVVALIHHLGAVLGDDEVVDVAEESTRAGAFRG